MASINEKELSRLIEEATAEVEALKDEIKAHMTAVETEELTAGVFKVRYTTVKSSRFDTAAFRKTHADLYEQYSRTTETRRFSIA
ncbi:MAG: hypothetical protein IJY93_01340 [Clostridia bacterium]|nr:hypothetical protein [Clostridia bacterium]